MKKQMELFEPVEGAFEEGGLMDEGGTVDPVSGNDVPVGSTQEEVRDDIPAQLSEGEFVLPADVVRYFGLEFIMKMRDEAKAGLAKMEAMGQMGNSEEAVLDNDVPFSMEDLDMEDDGMLEYAQGGVVKAQAGTFVQPATSGMMGTQQSQFSNYQGQYTPYQGQQFMSSPTGSYIPPTQQATPTTPQTQIPTFTQLTGTAQPSPGGYDTMKTYVNDAGMEMQIPFKDGNPIYPIPEGYKAKGEAVQTTQTTTTTGTGVETARDTGSDDSTAPEFSTTDVSGIGYDRSKIKNKDLLDAINKSAISQVKGIPIGPVSFGQKIAQEVGLKGSPKANSAILGGVIDQFRGGDVSFASGRKSGSYGIDTELHNLDDLQQQQIADVFKSVSAKMNDLYTKVGKDGERVGKTQTEVTTSLRAEAERLGISTTFGKSNVNKRNDTLAREISKANAQAEIDAKKAATLETAKTKGEAVREDRKQAAQAASSYGIDPKNPDGSTKSASQLRSEMQAEQKSRADAARERLEQARGSDRYQQAQDDGFGGTGYSSGTSFGGTGYETSTGEAMVAEGGLMDKDKLAKQMKQSGLASKK